MKPSSARSGRSVDARVLARRDGGVPRRSARRCGRSRSRRLARSCGSTCSPSSRSWSTGSARGACSARRAQTALLDLRLHDLREHTTDVHRTVDDSPFGGGAGMVIRPEPVFASVEAADPPRPLFLLGPGGDGSPARRRATSPALRRLQPALRALRGHRPPGPRAPRRRRAQRRRRRPQRGRGRRLPGRSRR